MKNYSQRPIVCGGVLVLLTLVAYLPALVRGGSEWGDDFSVAGDAVVSSTDGLVQIWTPPPETREFHPVVPTMLWAEYQLWGANPFGYHFVNALLHAINALLLWRLLAGLNVRGAWLAAAFWALHPACVEQAPLAEERTNAMAGALYLAAAIAYVEFWMWGGRSRRWVSYTMAFGWFVGALLCKSVTWTLPVALLLILWWKRGRVPGRDAWHMTPFGFIAVALGFTTTWIGQGRAMVLSATQTVWQDPLGFFRGWWPAVVAAWWQWALPGALIVLLVSLWLLRNRIGRGPVTAALVLVVSMGPALGVINIFPFEYTLVASRFHFLTSVALVALLATRLPRWGLAPLL